MSHPEPVRDRSASRRRAKRIVFALLASIGSLAVCLAALEFSMSFLRPSVEFEAWRRASYGFLLDDDVDWKLEPGVYDWGAVNALHFRGEAHAKGKRPGRLRIVLLGGSAAFDLGQPDGGTWAVRLANLLSSELGAPVDVVNCGTPGHSSWQCLRLLETKMLDWNPDAVILYELYNDSLAFRHSDPELVKRGWKLNAQANHIGRVAHPHRGFDACSMAFPRITDAVRMALLRRAIADSSRANAEFWWDVSLGSEASPAGIEFYRDNRRRIAKALVDAGEIPLILVTQASLIRPDNTPEERSQIHYWFRGFDHERLVDAYRQAREVDRELAAEFPTVVLLPAHEHVPASLEHFTDEVHFTPAGSESLARYVSRELVDSGVLQKRLDRQSRD